MKRLKKKHTDDETTEDTGTALAQPDSFLAELGGYQKHEAITYQADAGEGTFRFLRFYSRKANNAVDVVQALGKGIAEGHPYVVAGDDIVSVANVPFAVLKETPHWLTTGEDFAPNRAWLTPQPFGAKVEGDKVREAYVAVVLFFPEGEECFSALAEVRGTKAPFVKDYLGAVDKAATPEGARKLGQIASAMPPRFRVLATFKMVPKTAGNFAYALAKATTAPITTRQMEALSAWSKDDDAREELEANQSLYDRKVEELQALAASTEG